MRSPLSSSALGCAHPGASATPHTPCPQTLPLLCCPPPDSQTALCPSYVVAPKPAPSAGGEAVQSGAEWDNCFPCPAMLGLTHPRVVSHPQVWGAQPEVQNPEHVLLHADGDHPQICPEFGALSTHKGVSAPPSLASHKNSLNTTSRTSMESTEKTEK